MLKTIFTSGYSDELLLYNVDEEAHHVTYQEQCKVDPQFSFGYVSKKFNSIYFVHEVGDYDGVPNTGAVSRWKINLPSQQGLQNEAYQMGECPITKQEASYLTLFPV